MSAEEQAKFLEGLAQDLNGKSIALPSFPDAVINIRTALEDPKCTAERLADLARTDPVLVSRLLMSANSAFNNRAGIEIVDLDLAISRLGFEAVRNTAITLAVEQIFNAEQHEELKDRLKGLWTSSVNLASMSLVVGRAAPAANGDNAYLCGLLHEVGKLYILSKARDFPGFLGDGESVDRVLLDWHTSVGRSILGAWGFPDDIVASVELDQAADDGATGLFAGRCGFSGVARTSRCGRRGRGHRAARDARPRRGQTVAAPRAVGASRTVDAGSGRLAPKRPESDLALLTERDVVASVYDVRALRVVRLNAAGARHAVVTPSFENLRDVARDLTENHVVAA